VCPCAPTSFPLSFHHTPCRLRIAKAHQNKQLVKRYLARKARYLDGKAASEAAVASATIVPPHELVVVPESPVRTPIKPTKSQLLSPSTCCKIAENKAAALARRAALETAASTCVQTGLCVTCDQPCGDTMCAQCQMDVLAMPSPKRADAPKSPVPIDKMRRKNPPSKKRDDAQVIKRLTKAPKIFDV
jgi:hypothetical protein